MDIKRIVEPPKSIFMKSSRVILLPGESVGWHNSESREEMIIVLRGRATVMDEDTSTIVEAGQTYYVTENRKHNVHNGANFDLEYVYVVNPTIKGP